MCSSDLTGVGIDDLLEAMVKRLPAPKGDRNGALKALLVDSWYDPYLGVVTLVRVQDGVLRKGMRLRMMSTGAVHDLDRVGVFTPKPTDVAELGPGEVGFITAAIKTLDDALKNVRSAYRYLRYGEDTTSSDDSKKKTSSAGSAAYWNAQASNYSAALSRLTGGA